MDLVDGAARGGGPLSQVMGRLRRLGVVFPLAGFIFEAGHRHAGIVDGVGVCIEVSLPTLLVVSKVGDVASVEVVGSSPSCLCDCLDYLLQ